MHCDSFRQIHLSAVSCLKLGPGVLENFFSISIFFKNVLIQPFDRDKLTKTIKISVNHFCSKYHSEFIYLSYKQLKFNLLREESEGYAKLITELTKHAQYVESAQGVLERIRCLIGQFNLDPNRVLDIILECFESHLQSDTFVDLLRLYGSTSPIDYEPSSIFRLAAILIHYNLLDMLSLCRYLTPKLETIIQQVKSSIASAAQRQKKMSFSSMAANKEMSSSGDSHSTDEAIVINQKLELLCALLEIGEWKHAKALLDRLPEFYAVRNPIVATLLCRFVDYLIADFYARLRLPFLLTFEFFTDFVRSVFPKLHYLGPNIAVCPSLLTKVIRLCCSVFNGVRCLLKLVTKLRVIIPSLSLLKCNCAISEEIWLLLSQFPYATRYRLYGRWKNEHLRRHPQIILRKGEVMGKTRYIMKYVAFDIRLVFILLLSIYCQLLHISHPTPWCKVIKTILSSTFLNDYLTGVLQYVANQLKMGKSFDLLVLREIVENMSGIETTNGLTQEQLEALAGGDLLKLGVMRNTKRSVSRLKEALLQEDLVVSLCLLMAQQRACIVFHESQGIHLKLAGQMLDQCQETLIQFANFLSASLKTEDYAKRMPSAPALISAYHLGADAAMFLTRPSKYDELKKIDRANRTFTPDRKSVEDSLVTKKRLLNRSHTSKLVPFSARCFITFWMLSMYDLNVPCASYEREIEKMHQLGEAKRRKEKERYQQYENKLSEEQRRQLDHVNRVINMRCCRFYACMLMGGLCIFPRCLFSDLDAIFCAKFIQMMHSLKTRNFSTLICYDRIFWDICPVIACMSENEANHYGHFLCASLDTIMRWHESQDKFDKECANFPGFITRFRNAMTVNDPAKDVVDYENYRHVVHKWHFKITKVRRNRFLDCFVVFNATAFSPCSFLWDPDHSFPSEMRSLSSSRYTWSQFTCFLYKLRLFVTLVK
ncbi:unnamed protein product [Soboliphyme baturini]|uniref:THO complex subunit 2 n=1 Tax=Soboliphyme baturini TaxID=241478 RepID=A0A183IM50_9BILA|nr:unnamed protein product [Soboliphyme baturini]